jgi:hypothetical protein
MVAHIYNPSIWKQVDWEFKACLGYKVRSFLKKEREREREKKSKEKEEHYQNIIMT